MTAYVRHYPRYSWNGLVSATNSDGLSLQAHARNISLEGIHLIFDQASAQQIVPMGFIPNPAQPIQIELSIDEPGRKRMFFTVQVRGVRRLAQDAFSFHLEFVGVSSELADQLSNFIHSLPRAS